MTDKRVFELDDKFWEVWTDGAQVFTRHGKQGASGQTKIKPTADEAAAATQLEDMVAKKRKEGYKQTGGPKPPAGPALDAKELKRVLSTLTDVASYLVLADWLQAQNHPWGELIALQVGAATTPKKATSLQQAADKLLEEKADAILGPLAEAKHTQLTWQSGFVQRAVIGSAPDQKAILAALKAFLAQPIAHVVETIVFGPIQDEFPVWRDWDSSDEHIVDPWSDLDKLAAAIPARVTRLGFGSWPAAAANAYIRMPSFAKLSKAFPKLTALELTGSAIDKPGTLNLPALTELAIRFANAGSRELEALAGSKLPKLERLTLGLGGQAYVLIDEVYPPNEWDEDDEDAPRYPATFSAADMDHMNSDHASNDTSVDAFDAVLAGPGVRALKHLAIVSSCLNAELIGALVKSPLVKRLKTLDLSHGQLGDDEAKVLIGAKKQLGELAKIDLRHNRLTAAGAKKVSAALPNATVTSQDKQSPGPEFFFRYIAAME
jgi:uncharacterized protein (TIGR02996 family)